MNNYILLILVLLSTGCATIKPPIGKQTLINVDKITDIESLYAQLYSRNKEWHFEDICDVSGNIPGYPRCNSINSPRESYISLKTLKPAFPIQSYICDTTSNMGRKTHIRRNGGQNKKISQCKPSDYWESDLSWSEFASWLLIIPMSQFAYTEEVYFNFDAFNSALKEANKNFNRDQFTRKLNNKLKKQKSEIAQQEKYKIKEKQKKAADFIQRKALFTRNIAKKTVGKEVCSVDHKIGYVEQIADTRIKVHVKGQAFTESRIKGKAAMQGYELVSKKTPPDYFLFQSDEQSFKVNSLNTIIWDDFNKWATCDISGY